MKMFTIFLLMLFFASTSHSTEWPEKTFRLNSRLLLKVMEQEDLSAVAEITYDGRAYHIATIENAAISEVRKVRLCSDCKENYFISLYDRSSTYGATTGIVAWQNEWGNWRLQVLPFSVAGIEDENKDGVFELVDFHSGKTENKFCPAKIKYKFRNGLVWPE